MPTRARGTLASCALGLLLVLTTPGGSARAGSPTTDPHPKAQTGVGSAVRWVRVEANLFVDRPADLLPTLTAACDAGANGIVLVDSKTMSWPGFDRDDRRFWLQRARAVRDDAHGLGLELVLDTDPLGYCSSLLSYDVDLAAGVPVRRAPLVVRGGRLVPEQTAALPNGSFERFGGDTVRGWTYQDDPGTATVVDTSVAHDGAASLRMEPTGDATRVFGEVRVRPFQQYVLSFWVRASGLTASYLGPYVASPDGRTRLSDQMWSDRGRDGSYFSSADGLDLGWTQQRIAFDSRELHRVGIGLGAWGHTGGTLWVDDVRVTPAPTLNLLRRPDLPLRLTTGSGRPLVEGRDVERVRDPGLGRQSWRGTYDTFHRGPSPRLLAGSGLRTGDRVLLSGQAATVTMSGQVGCSWNHPDVLALLRRIHAANQRALHPDGFMLGLDEIRSGGWDPQDARFASSGDALAHHLTRVLAELRQVAPGVPVYVWSDMFDPTQNAVRHYYQVKGSLRHSWRTLRPGSVTIVNWKAGSELRRRGERSVRHFADLGFRQVLAGFYDEPVARNHDDWVAAAGDAPRIRGSMYTSWEEDYSALPEFGSLWWPPA